MAIDTGPYIRRAMKLARRRSGENFAKFSRLFAPQISNADMNQIRKNFNEALDEMMRLATNPKDVEMTLRHEASHLAAAFLLGFPPTSVDLVPHLHVRVEGYSLHTTFLNVPIYGYVHHERPALSPETTKEEAESVLAKLATVAAVGKMYEEKTGYSNGRHVKNLGDREKIEKEIAWAESQTGMELVDPDSLWEIGLAGARHMLESPKFIEMVEAVADVLSRSNGKQAVDGARKAMERYSN